MQRIPAVVRYLATLPRELVHQVLNDLSIYKVLSLAIHGVTYINECILSHLQIRELFPSPTHLSDACSYFQLYTDIYNSRAPGWHSSKVWSSSLEKSFYNPRRRSYNYKALIQHLCQSIAKALEDANGRLPLLSAFLTAPLSEFRTDAPSSYLDLQHHWISLRQAQNAINSIKSSQLNRLADLIESYPFALKMAMDPSQERRRNYAHIVAYIRHSANRVKHARVIDHKVICHHLFAVFPLVPYDRYLKLFLKTIKRYPPQELCAAGLSDHRRTDTVIRAVEGEGKQLGSGTYMQADGASISSRAVGTSDNISASGTEGNAQFNKPPISSEKAQQTNEIVCEKAHYPYPEVVAQTIVSVIKGMAHVYTSAHPQALVPSPSKIVRTKYTSYSAAPYHAGGGLKQPMFVTPNIDDIRTEFEPLPLCEKEIEWLTGFLDVCAFASRMEDAKWTSEQTVAEMWRRMMD